MEGGTGDMGEVIRRVCIGDESVLAQIQTESWKAAFQNILSKEVLEKVTAVHQAESMYRRLLKEKIGNGYILEINGAGHCIAWWDEARDLDCSGSAELICIHSLCDRWGHGYGRKMMEKVLADIKAAGYAKVVLWTFEENGRARRFYEKLGFSADGKTKTSFGTQEIRYEKVL